MRWPGSHDSENPTLSVGNKPFLRRQRRIEVAGKYGIPVGTLQPRRRGVCRVFVAVAANTPVRE
jgi:hypothetical protein